MMNKLPPDYWVNKMAVEKEWDSFRKVVIRNEFNFGELQEINDKLHSKFPPQNWMDKARIGQLITSINPSSVVEFGCGQGFLAKTILGEIGTINSWHGYDISTECLRHKVVDDQRFIATPMNNWLHLLDLPLADLFISTHTLEHLSIEHLVLTLEKIADTKYNNVVLELPLMEEDHAWRGGGSTHVLSWGRKKIRESMALYGYVLQEEISIKHNLWLAHWKLSKPSKIVSTAFSSSNVVSLGCVYKSGGDYVSDHVAALDYSVRKHSKGKARTICYTDKPEEVRALGVEAIPLLTPRPGWWSVPEVFRTKGPTVVVGLDTVFVRDISTLLQVAIDSKPNDFWMITNFGSAKQGPASGIMAWNGDWEWLYSTFDYDTVSKRLRGDENWTLEALNSRGIEPKILQNKCKGLSFGGPVDGIYSFKGDVRGKLCMPDDATIIVFHGKPRPHEITSAWRRLNYPLLGEGPRRVKNG